MPNRKPYPTDVTDEEWAFVAPYLTLLRADAPQRVHDLREVFDALRWIVRAGAPWRMMPHDLPPWEAVYQQTQRWINAGVSAGGSLCISNPGIYGFYEANCVRTEEAEDDARRSTTARLRAERHAEV